MARVFISSTFADLKEQREEASRALRRAGHEVLALEDYLAADERPRDVTLRDIARADLCVLIVAHRYGYIPTEDNPDRRSITDIEYRHARTLHKPLLVFLLDSSAPWPPSFFDIEARDRINEFRDELSREHLVGYFRTTDDLSGQVVAAVARWDQERNKRPETLTLELLPLAWRLVVDFKAEPDLLRHLDLGIFTIALEKWEEENGSAQNASWAARLDSALKRLEEKQGTHAPSPLWLAWMHATRSPGERSSTDRGQEHQV